MDNQELLQAISQMMDEKLEAERANTAQMMDEKLQPIKNDLAVLKDDVAVLKDDVAVLKEEAAITRHSTNILLRWAERAERTVNVGLYNGDSN